MKENRCFFRFLEIGVISFEYREIGERYARYVSSLTNKQTKGRKFEIFASVSYRSNTGKERKKKSRENRWKIANFDNFWLTAVFFTAKVAFWRAWMKNEVTFEICASQGRRIGVFFQVSWIRCHIGRIQRDLREICQICVQLNKRTNKTIWKRPNQRGKLNKQTSVKTEKTTARLKRPSKKKLESRVSLETEHFWGKK